MIRYFFYMLLFFILPSVASAQLLKGRLQNEKKQGIPYATVYIKNVKQGISTNENGYFELKLPAGNYTVIFQCLGYEVLTHEITLPQTEDLIITLTEKSYELRGISLSSKGEDPARVIMRRAIAMAPYYRNIVKEYTADVYLKTKIHIAQLKGVVGLALKKKEKEKLTNATIIQESLNEVKFTAPNNYEQRIKSMVNASNINLADVGLDDIEEDLKIGITRINIYGTDPSLPLAIGAFSNYVFKYEGDMVVNNRIVNKIKVTPRRKNQNLVSGYLYILDKTWNVYSLDLLQKNIVGTVRMQQNYGDVGQDIFLPISYNAEINLSLLGIKGSGNMTGSIKYQHVLPNEKIASQPLTVAKVDTGKVKENPQKEKLQEQVAQLLQKENLKAGDMQKIARIQQKITDTAEKEELQEKGEKKSLEISSGNYKIVTDSNARHTDTSFWNAVRPMPLIAEEIVTYRKNDSIVSINTGKDTLTGKESQHIIFELLSGNTYRIDTSMSITFNGLLGTSSLDYNTVDGYIYKLSGSINKQFENQKRWQAKMSSAWAFSRKAFMWDVSLRHDYAPKLRAFWEIQGGQHTKDFAGKAGIGMVNAYSSELFRVNYTAFYLDNFIHLHHRIDILNGLEFHTSMSWSDRKEMQNHSNYSFFFSGKRDFRANIPRHAAVETNPELLTDNKAAIATLSLRYTPQYYYRMSRGRKIMVRSDYPTFTLTWNKGIPSIFQSNSDFDFLKFNISQSIQFGYLNQFGYMMETGKFFHIKSLSFSDFKHFKVNDAGFSMNHSMGDAYQLLHNYTNSTNEWYVAAKINYSTPYLLIKRLPFLESMLFNEDLYASYLLEPQQRHYAEIGYGLSLGELIQTGIFAGFDNGKYIQWGVRVTFNMEEIL